MIVRDATSGDLPQLAAAVATQPLLQRYGTQAAKLARDLAAALEAGQGMLVAEDGARLLGIAWFLPSGTFAAGGYLRLIALAPGEEGHGAGGALLDEVERRVAQASRSLFLLVSHWNEGARRFYARRGYVEVGTIPAFVRADTDEVICYKRLAP
ncbi:MAG TPA: GNAT family N-acetyltransferase [Polyangia bacterium]|nr:GNAT family N-acetyltransferase [Polyangia bacterium]